LGYHAENQDNRDASVLVVRRHKQLLLPKFPDCVAEDAVGWNDLVVFLTSA
jgi:hypothetical protein